ncbi:MAG: hypothetical protein ACREOI_13655 [bacterium]
MISTGLTFDELKQKVTQLALTEQLKLVSYICEQLTAQSLVSKTLASKDDTLLRQKEADKLLALCDAAAEMWKGEFDAAEDVRQMRRERDDQIWANKL